MRELQRWHCDVIEVHDEIVYLRAIDVTAGDVYPEEDMEIPIGNFQPFDRHRLTPGQCLDVVITEDETNATHLKITLAEPRVWTKEEIADLQRKAKVMADALEWE